VILPSKCQSQAKAKSPPFFNARPAQPGLELTTNPNHKLYHGFGMQEIVVHTIIGFFLIEAGY
jgi:hypothetical protein